MLNLSRRYNSSVRAKMVNACGTIKEYQVVGRMLPTKSVTSPPIYRMNIYSKNEVAAKSKFWYFLKKMKKIKKTKGEILEVKKTSQKKPTTVKNFGILLRMDTRTKPLNMYREYRDTTLNGAINKCYADVAGKHSARSKGVHIIKTEVLKPTECKKKHIKQFHDSHIEFPILHRVTKSQKKCLFSGKRPCTVA